MLTPSLGEVAILMNGFTRVISNQRRSDGYRKPEEGGMNAGQEHSGMSPSRAISICGNRSCGEGQDPRNCRQSEEIEAEEEEWKRFIS